VGNIDIQGITTSGENGLRFSGPFSAIRTDGQAFGRYTIQYDVTILDPGFLLSDIHHSFLFLQSGFGGAAVTTRAGTTPAEGPFAQLASEVFSSSLIDESANLRDALADIDVAVPSIAIFQVFQVSSDPGFDIPGSAQIGFVDVTFSQISVVPEPSTLALLGIGALGIIGYGRWR
jgi:PEP-CTERM motif